MIPNHLRKVLTITRHLKKLLKMKWNLTPMTLTLIYIVMTLSDHQKVLAVGRCLLKLLKSKIKNRD